MNMHARYSALFMSLVIFGCVDKYGRPLDDDQTTGPPPWCAPSPPPNPGGPNNPVDASTEVIIKKDDGADDYKFFYCGFFASAKGDLHFKGKPQSMGRPVTIKFRIDQVNSISGVEFVSPGEDAMWIEEVVLAPNEACVVTESPGDTPKPSQFSDFETKPNGKNFSVRNENDDDGCYRYALRFKLANGDVIMDDPVIRNDGLDLTIRPRLHQQQ